MNYEVYSGIKANDDLSVFKFISIGPKGEIQKGVAFLPSENPTVFYLALADLIGEDAVPDDEVISNNGDRNKVLATVAQITITYTKAYPQRWIYFRGSTAARTRLYRMAIHLNLDELSSHFDIFGVLESGESVRFKPGQHYHGFLVRRKKQ